MGWALSRLDRPGVFQSTLTVILPTVFLFFNKPRDKGTELEAPKISKFLIARVALRKFEKATPNYFS